MCLAMKCQLWPVDREGIAHEALIATSHRQRSISTTLDDRIDMSTSPLSMLEVN
jgi:hypothetical protein